MMLTEGKDELTTLFNGDSRDNKQLSTGNRLTYVIYKTFICAFGRR